MIKKFCLIITFLIFVLFNSASVFALDWGVFDDYEDNAENYALYNALYNIPINYTKACYEKDDSWLL